MCESQPCGKGEGLKRQAVVNKQKVSIKASTETKTDLKSEEIKGHREHRNRTWPRGVGSARIRNNIRHLEQFRRLMDRRTVILNCQTL